MGHGHGGGGHHDRSSNDQKSDAHQPQGSNAETRSNQSNYDSQVAENNSK